MAQIWHTHVDSSCCTRFSANGAIRAVAIVRAAADPERFPRLDAFRRRRMRHSTGLQTTGALVGVIAFLRRAVRLALQKSVAPIVVIPRHDRVARFKPISAARLSAGVLAVSTVGLWVATVLLYRAGERALETTERAFVFIDGFNIELTIAADSSAVENEILPQTYRNDPGLFITRFAAQPRWKNSGTTPVQDLKIRVNWRGPEGPIHPDVSAFTYSGDQMPFFLGPQAVEARSAFS